MTTMFKKPTDAGSMVNKIETVSTKNINLSFESFGVITFKLIFFHNYEDIKTF